MNFFDFEQCFPTGRAVEMMPVGRIDQAEFEVGGMTLMLRQEYLKLTAGTRTVPATSKARA